MHAKKTVTVRTEKGKPDSLKESVRIAFTITPSASEENTHPYDPIARSVTVFEANGEQSVHTHWWKTINYLNTYKLNDKKAALVDSADPVPPGSTITWTNFWGRPSKGVRPGPASIMVTNKSGSEANVALGWYLAYRPLNKGDSIIMPCSKNLQAYIVKTKIEEDRVLKPEDLERPIFPTAINCDTLPDKSAWILCQDSNGKIRLRSDDSSCLGNLPNKAGGSALPDRPQPAQSAEPPHITQQPQVTQLSQVLERLTMMEDSISRIRDDVSVGQQAMAEMQSRLLALEGASSDAKEGASTLNRNVANMETKVIALAESFNRNQDRLSTVQKATSGIQQTLTDLSKTVSVTNNEVLDLTRRVPVVESKIEKTTVSLARSQGRLSALEEAAACDKDRVDSVEKLGKQTQEQVAVVQQLVVATNSQLSLLKHIQASETDEPSSPRPSQTANVDRRLPVLEAQVEKMEKSLGQTQKQLVLVRNMLNTMDRRVPVVESKTGKLEISIGRTQADLIEVQVSLTELDRRVASIEARSGDVDFGDDGDGGDHSSPWAPGSPVTFPSHPAESPLALSPTSHDYISR